MHSPDHSPSEVADKGHRKWWWYPAAVALVYLCWITFMTLQGKWHLFETHWQASLTMVLGSFVAGATAEGGGAVAYPVFTKILKLASTDARTFSLMIQAFGMGMATLFIYTRRIPVLKKVILLVSGGGLLGHVAGIFWLNIPGDYPKLLFSFVTTAFGVVLYLSTYWIKWKPLSRMPEWNFNRSLTFFLVGIAGGIFASQVGSGIDVITFMVLTLAFGIDERISTPTTVVIMAINSWVGFLLHWVVLDDIGEMWNYWLVSVEVVVLGAPLGAYVISRISRYKVINFLLLLITIELISTLILVPIESNTQSLIMLAVVSGFTLFFAVMLNYRHRHLK